MNPRFPRLALRRPARLAALLLITLAVLLVVGTLAAGPAWADGGGQRTPTPTRTMTPFPTNTITPLPSLMPTFTPLGNFVAPTTTPLGMAITSVPGADTQAQAQAQAPADRGFSLFSWPILVALGIVLLIIAIVLIGRQMIP